MAAAVAPAAAQTGAAQSSPVARYHLMQLTVQTADISPAAFRAQTQAIASCGDAKRLIGSLGAQWSRNRFVRASQLPADIAALLADQPTGHASPVLAASGNAMSVLVICHRV